MQKSDPFGGARPIDEKLAAERRQKLLEEKVGPRYVRDVFILIAFQAQLEATRRAEAKLSLELSAKQPSDKDASKHQVNTAFPPCCISLSSLAHFLRFCRTEGPYQPAAVGDAVVIALQATQER